MQIIEHKNLKKILMEQEHRPYQLPDSPWVSTQKWEDVLFLHWPVSPKELRPHIPPCLHLDLYDDAAWLGIVFFQVKGMRPRALPSVPCISSYLQLNVRTYTTYMGKPGIYFISLDVNSRLASILARAVYSLPFRAANMKIDKQGNEINMVSVMDHSYRKEGFSCGFTPVSPAFYAKVDSFDYWLLERYCLWSLKRGNLFRTDIHHTKWSLQKAEVIIRSNSMASFLPRKSFLDDPIVHYSALKHALFWLPVREETND